MEKNNVKSTFIKTVKNTRASASINSTYLVINNFQRHYKCCKFRKERSIWKRDTKVQRTIHGCGFYSKHVRQYSLNKIFVIAAVIYVITTRNASAAVSWHRNWMKQTRGKREDTVKISCENAYVGRQCRDSCMQLNTSSDTRTRTVGPNRWEYS